MNTRPIGILDSGVGGLTLAKEIRKLLPHESIIYIADSKNTPYGNKSPDEIYQLAKQLIEFLVHKNVKLIVVACNTITVTCLELLRKDYPTLPIIGTVPVVKTAAEVSKNKRIGVLSTTNTAKSQYQQDLIKRFAQGCTVFNHGTDELVPLIERGELSGEKMIEKLQAVLAPLQEEYIDTLALGCTHFPLLREQMQQILGQGVTILDSGAAIARQVKRVLENNNALATTEQADFFLYTTGDPDILLRLVANEKIAHDMIQSVIL